jgi:apolipoprotein N-acyltransferase
MVVATLLYGTWRLRQPLGEGAPLTVAIVQPGYPAPAGIRDLPRARRTAEARGAALERQLTLTRRALADRPALVVWPENAVDVYVEQPGTERDAFLAAIRSLGVDLIVGGPAYVYGPAGLRYRNAVYALRDGQVAGRYDKLHLLPFAEARGGEGGLEAGTYPYALRAGGTLVGAFVCFEAMYPELVRRIASDGVELLANLSNDAWFAAAAPSQLHLDMAAMRAIEQRRWLLRATTTGISAILAPSGRIVAATPLDEPAVLTGTVFRSRVRTVYARWGDVPAWTALGLVLGVSLVRLFSERRRRIPPGGPSCLRSASSFW